MTGHIKEGQKVTIQFRKGGIVYSGKVITHYSAVKGEPTIMPLPAIYCVEATEPVKRRFRVAAGMLEKQNPDAARTKR